MPKVSGALMEEELIHRIQRLEDIESIRKLKHQYCYACDDNYNVSKLRPLFAADAVWQADGFGKCTGPDEIGNFFRGVSQQIVAAAHLVMNDIIDIEDNGCEASGVWRNIQPVNVSDENGNSQAMWMLARYDEKYIKLENKWLFKELIASIQFTAPYEQGWADLWVNSNHGIKSIE